MATNDVTADTILALLASRHSGDVFVPECKTGASQYSGSPRMDAWALRKSWANPCASSYEIKVSRNDFLRDKKWRAYLPYCNEFYFAVAHGVAQVEEIPEEAGLLVGSRNTRRLHTKKKAPWRDVEIPESIYRYVLFSRVRVTREHVEDKGAFWRDVVAGKRELRDLGLRVSRKIQVMISEQIKKAEEENRRLAKENEGFAAVARICESLGISAGSYSPEWATRKQIERLQSVLPMDIIRDAQSAHRSLAAFLKAVDGEDEG